MKELLVPVGSMASLRVAVFSGADAVYLGGKRFGARAYANNFEDSEMIEAIKFAHLFGVKIYVTVNTLIHEDEIDSVMEYVDFLHRNNVDALIVQDLGLITLIRETYPNLDIHVSTQAHTTNERTIKLFESLGVKRIVLAREVPINTINSFKTELEIEAFIHGALCISYSGQCLFSSVLMNRSGNRGECAGICRLPFRLKENDKLVDTNGEYLLSTKELNTSDYFKSIMESNIYSLKIEGRMKGPEYVGCVTRLYRDLIDKYYRGEELTVDEELLNDLNVIFNREYTKGFLFNSNNQELMNTKTPNHLGIKIGEVIAVDKKYITIKLTRNLNQGDGIRFMNSGEGMILNYLFDNNDLLINSHDAGSIVKVLNKCNATIGEIVNKTFDVKVAEKYRDIPQKRIEIDINFTSLKNGLAVLDITDGVNVVSVKDTIVEKSINNPTTEYDIIKQLSKLGNTAYEIKQINVYIDDDIFIRVGSLNELRRKTIAELDELRVGYSNYKKIDYRENISILKDKGIHFSFLVRNEEQLKYLIDKQYILIVSDKKLFEKYKDNANVYYQEMRVGEVVDDKFVATELGGVIQEKSVFGDYYLNITNHYTLNYLSRYLKVMTLSPEISDNQIINIMNNYRGNAEVYLYGRLELMLTKYCLLNLLVNKDKVCSVCKNNNTYKLVDRNNYEYPIIQDKDIHITHILDNKITNKINRLNDYISYGVNYFRIELFDENPSEIEEILEMIGEAK